MHWMTHVVISGGSYFNIARYSTDFFSNLINSIWLHDWRSTKKIYGIRITKICSTSMAWVNSINKIALSLGWLSLDMHYNEDHYYMDWRTVNTKVLTLKTRIWRQDMKMFSVFMMTSSNGNIVRVTGHLCGEFTGPRWSPRTKASDAELCVFFHLRMNKLLSKQSWGWWFEKPSVSLWRHCNVLILSPSGPLVGSA